MASINIIPTVYNSNIRSSWNLNDVLSPTSTVQYVTQPLLVSIKIVTYPMRHCNTHHFYPCLVILSRNCSTDLYSIFCTHSWCSVCIIAYNVLFPQCFSSFPIVSRVCIVWVNFTNIYLRCFQSHVHRVTAAKAIKLQICWPDDMLQIEPC